MKGKNQNLSNKIMELENKLNIADNEYKKLKLTNEKNINYLFQKNDFPPKIIQQNFKLSKLIDFYTRNKE